MAELAELAELAALQRAIGELARLDADALEDDQLHAAVVAVQRERARLGLVAAQLLSRWDARRIWADDSYRSAAARLSRDTSCAPASASVELRRARQLRGLPATAAAIAGGELSLDHVDLLGRANQPCRVGYMAEHEHVLVRECARLRFAQASRMIEHGCQRVDAEAGYPDATGANGHDAHLHAAATLGGTVVVDGVLDAIGGAIVISELDRLERELRLTDQREGCIRTIGQRRAAALVSMAQRSAT